MRPIIRLLTLCALLGSGVAPATSRCAAEDPSSASAQEQRPTPGAALRDERVTIRTSDLSLKAIFDAVEAQTRFRFVYMKDDLPLLEPSPAGPGEYSLGALLEDLSRRHQLVFSRVNDRIVVRRTGAARAETAMLIGTVRDASTNEPLVFATVAVEGTQQGTTADANGRYVLRVAPGACTLRCAFVGYRTEVLSVTIEGDSQLNIALTATDLVLQDVTVFAHRLEDAGQPEVNALTLQSETIKRVTSLIPDVMRSVQMLPGVSTNNEFSSRFNVRGGNQDENLVVVNGTQVYDPFHVKEVSNASIGIFNADMIRKMDLITGGFTARYGDKMSSVLNIEYREGSRERLKGMLSLSMMDANALIEGPIGEQGSFIIGGRKSYFEYVMKLVDAGPYVHPSFYDIQGVFAYAPSAAGKLMLKLIHSGDDFFEDPHREYDPPSQWTGYDRAGARYTVTQQWNDSVDNKATYYSNMAALQYTHVISSDAVVKSEVSLYDQRENEDYWSDYYYRYKAENPQTTYFYNTTQQYQNRNILSIRTLEANSALDLQIAPSYGIKTGLSYQDIRFKQERLDRHTIEEFTNQFHFPDTTLTSRSENAADDADEGINTRSFKAAGYIENVVQLGSRLLVNAGGRLDYFGLNKDLTLSPRLNLSYQAAAGLVLRAAWGHFYQSPVYKQIAYPTASDTNTRSQRAVHTVVGIDYEIEVDRAIQHFVRFKVEGYHKRYTDLITGAVTSRGVVNYTRKNDAEGSAYGIDVQVIYSAPRFYGWVSYGYLFARQTSTIGTVQATFPPYTDQRHTLALTGEFDLGKEWSVSSRFVYGSGYPFTPAYVSSNPTTGTRWVSESIPNSSYLPAYTRVDLKVSKDLSLLGGATSIFIDVSNLFNSKNIQAYRYRFNSQGQPIREDVNLWPILPTFGLAVKF